MPVELPKRLSRIGVPPVKCQGIKTKLVPFILGSIKWKAYENSRWIEPFLGSGSVAFNVCPEAAILSDTNRHIIDLYKAIQRGDLDAQIVKYHLTKEGIKLEKSGGSYYYEVRDRFNETSAPLDFIFLNRSCFNGVMRFNSSGKFNVPFGRKPDRFSRPLITKICNQVSWAACQMKGRRWDFRISPWKQILKEAKENDFVYLDPPYIGRHTDYYNAWSEEDAEALASEARKLPCGFALSMWFCNRFRENPHLAERWAGLEMRLFTHFYHVGSNEEFRNEMIEALVIKPGYSSEDTAAIEYTGPGKNKELDLDETPSLLF